MLRLILVLGFAFAVLLDPHGTVGRLGPGGKYVAVVIKENLDLQYVINGLILANRQSN
jgi:hypothetical protein